MSNTININPVTQAINITTGINADLLNSARDVFSFASLATFPNSGIAGKIYIALDTNLQYRWNGSTYVQIGGSDPNAVSFGINQTLNDVQAKRAKDNIKAQSQSLVTVGKSGTGSDFFYPENMTPESLHFAEAVNSSLNSGLSVSLLSENINFINKTGPSGRINPISNRTIKGQGIDSTIINSSRPDYVVRYINSNNQNNNVDRLENFTLSDLTIDCLNALNSAGIEIRKFQNLKLKNLKLKNSNFWLLKLTNEPSRTSDIINEEALILVLLLMEEQQQP